MCGVVGIKEGRITRNQTEVLSGATKTERTRNSQQEILSDLTTSYKIPSGCFCNHCVDVLKLTLEGYN